MKGVIGTAPTYYNNRQIRRGRGMKREDTINPKPSKESEDRIKKLDEEYLKKISEEEKREIKIRHEKETGNKLRISGGCT